MKRPARPLARVVLDSNVFLSGVFLGGVPGRILDAWQDECQLALRVARGGGELGESLDALEEADNLRAGRVAEWHEPEELIGRDLERACELDEHRAGGWAPSAS